MKKRTLLFLSSIVIASTIALPTSAAQPDRVSAVFTPPALAVATVKAPTPKPTIVAAAADKTQAAPKAKAADKKAAKKMTKKDKK